jgi:formate dehydrogenase major subunit
MSEICGIDAEILRAVARRFATAKASMILWGMGISQHIHGTDNARCLIALSMITGQIGRPGTGLHPLRGQNNVQGASDAGLIPMMLPDYQRVDNSTALTIFEALWNTKLDPNPGLTVVEIMHAAAAGKIRGMYVEGENPAMSDPDLHHARAALAKLEHLVVQDIFMTETALLADLILPATAHAEKWGTFTNTDRLVQLGRPALKPPGQARPDLWIIRQIGRRMGLDWQYDENAEGHPDTEQAVTGEIYEEMRKAMPSIRGITWQRLLRDGAAIYPCENESEAGEPIVFIEDFPTPSGRAKLVPALYQHPAEEPDTDFPYTLITGRQLEHWHTGSMTRNTKVLDAIEPAPTVMMHPTDLEILGIVAGATVHVESRRGTISLPVRSTEEVAPGTVFIPFAYVEAAANSLTIAALDPIAKIPEFKLCAVRVTRA